MPAFAPLDRPEFGFFSEVLFALCVVLLRFESGIHSLAQVAAKLEI